MDSREIASHPLIRQYVNDFADQLANFQQADRQQHVMEITDHLQSLVEEKMGEGKPIDEAVHQTLTAFLPAAQLAEQIMGEERRLNVDKDDGRRHVAAETNSKAIVSLIFGILSILLIIVPWIGLIIALIGLIFGIMALSVKAGKRLAVAGIICSSAGIILPILLSILAYLAFMNPTFELQVQ